MTRYTPAVGCHSGAFGPRGSSARQFATGDGRLNFDQCLVWPKGVFDLALDSDVIRK